ncbi:MAG TPA: LysM peptidoglycan-binding domain-containing protein [Mycobacteriales bacterium]|nr:LysM peptidoglycan-binding domain-containing protein [Mycobacteriales bacterium]
MSSTAVLAPLSRSALSRPAVSRPAVSRPALSRPGVSRPARGHAGDSRSAPVRSHSRASTARPSAARPCRAVGDGSSWRTEAPAAARAGVRLTRRGRLVVVAVLVGLLLAAFSLGRVGAEGSTSTQRVTTSVITVAPGDTLWGVAQRLAPGQDPRPVVDQIRELNDLEQGGLRVGQQLVLPGPAD